MKSVGRVAGMVLVTVVAWILVSQSVHAASTAKNRNDVYAVLENLNSNLTLSGLDLWVNENSEEPSVKIGDTLYFTMTSAEPAFYTLLHVDSKGSTSILSPMENLNSADYLIYPSLTDKCEVYMPMPECFDTAGVQFKQAEPIGKDAVFLLASKQPISNEVLGFSAGSDYEVLGKDLNAITDLVQRINDQAAANPIAVTRHTYAVESEQTQYTTRSIRRKVKELEEKSAEIEPGSETPLPSFDFNKINFAFNSDELTVPGQVELDGLGSVLVDMQEENGEFPVVELTGHTDSTGSKIYNLSLSANRAKSAKRYLMEEHGVPENYVLTLGVGESVPITSNASRDGRADNRRVEFRVINVL